jgi:hypothetical protein
MFAGKARAYPSEAPFKCSTLRMVARLKDIPLQGTAVVLSFNTFHFAGRKNIHWPVQKNFIQL